jgi:hypothetical protein
LNYCSKILAFDAAFLKEIKYFWKHNSISKNIINGFTMMSLWDMTSKTIIWFIHWFTKPSFFVDDVQSSSNFLIRNVSFGESSKFFLTKRNWLFIVCDWWKMFLIFFKVFFQRNRFSFQKSFCNLKQDDT